MLTGLAGIPGTSGPASQNDLSWTPSKPTFRRTRLPRAPVRERRHVRTHKQTRGCRPTYPSSFGSTAAMPTSPPRAGESGSGSRRSGRRETTTLPALLRSGLRGPLLSPRKLAGESENGRASLENSGQSENVHHWASFGEGRLVGQEPPREVGPTNHSERDQQARCIFAQPGHRKSPATSRRG